MFKSLCVFMSSGRTFTFKDVVIIYDNEHMLSFRYSAMSDGLEKVMTIYKNTGVYLGHSTVAATEA